MKNENTIDVHVLQQQLNTVSFGRKVIWLQRVCSTQHYLKQQIQQGAKEGTVVVAEEQTAGRGRLQKKWFSPCSKGIWMSLLLCAPQPAANIARLTLLTGVAVCFAIRMCTGFKVQLKWPNDIVYKRRKVCGILLESVGSANSIRYCIVGIGVNVDMTEEDYPDDIKEIATSLCSEDHQPIDRTRLMAAILNEMERIYLLYQRQGFSPISQMWCSLSMMLGREVRVLTSSGFVQGQAIGIHYNGALLINDRTFGITQVVSGDIQFI